MEEEATTKKVRKRKDVSDKKKKDEDEYVVKQSLRSSLRGSKNERKFIENLFKKWSDAVSQRINFASRALTLLLKTSFHNCQNYKNTPLPEFLDQTFIRQAMLGFEGTSVQNPSLKELFDQNPKLLRNIPRYQGDCNMYTATAKNFITNMKNSLSCIFEGRLLKLIKFTKEEMKWEEKEIIKIVRHYLLGDFLSIDIPKISLETKYPSIIAFVAEVKDFLGLKENQIITEAWLKSNSYQVIRFYAFILSKLSQQIQISGKKQIKSFNLLPLTDVRNHFATYDANCFLGIFKDFGILSTKATREVITEDFLGSIFNIPKKNFTGTIQSDGTSICFHFTRPKVKLSKEDIKEKIEKTKEIFAKKETRKLGCDPGRESIYTIVEEGTNKSWMLSRNQYYFESGVFESREKTKAWSKDILHIQDKLSKVTSKGISLISYVQYIDVFISTYDTLWKEYSKTKWAAQRLRLYGKKKKCFDKFWNNVLGKENTRNREIVIAYGGAKFAPGGKGEINVPTSRAFKECQKQKGLKTLIVDEFRTSKLHHENHTLLHKVKVRGADKSLRGLLWCCSTISNQKQGFFVNRDINAAWNILKLALERPIIFQRLKTNRRLVQKTLKVLKPHSCKPRTYVASKSPALGDCKKETCASRLT